MKTLNKTLCLVLALVMVLGLFGVASAAGTEKFDDFTDKTDVQYEEAVSVLTGIGAINGMGDGTFAPKANVTRAQGAKIVAYAILGETIAKQLTSTASSFTDVDANTMSWAGGAIEYLVKEGIINGRGEGKFDPYGQITGYEMAKMLLCAVGYGANAEYTGAQWQLNVAVDASKLGVFKDSKAAAFDTGATREETALYIFNAITTIEQVKFNQSSKLYEEEDGSALDNNTILDDIYKDKQLLTPAAATDDYGRPATQWKYGVDQHTIAFVVEKPVLTYTTKFVPADAYKALKDKGVKFDPIPAFATVTDKMGGNGIAVEFYVDEDNYFAGMVTINSFFAAATAYKEDSAKTVPDDRTVTFDTTAATTAIYGVAKDLTAIPASDNNDGTKGFETAYAAVKSYLDGGKEIGLLLTPGVTAYKRARVNDSTGKAPGDAGYVTTYGYAFVTGGYIAEAAIPTSKDLTITSIKSDAATGVISFVADGTTYEPQAYSAAALAGLLKVDGKYTVYFDQYGYAVYAKVIEEASTVVAIVNGGKVANAGTLKETINAEVVKTDATSALMPVNAYEEANLKSADQMQYDLYAAKEGTGTNKGYYTFTAGAGYNTGVDTGEACDGSYAANEADSASAKPDPTSLKTIESVPAFGLVSGNAALTYNGKAYSFDNKTIFIVETNKYDVTGANAVLKAGTQTYKTYTGIKNVPTITNAAGASFYTEKLNDKYVDVVFIHEAIVKSASTEVVALLSIEGKDIKTTDGIVHDAALISGSTITPVQVSDEIYTAIAAATGMDESKNENTVALIDSYVTEKSVITEIHSFTNNDTSKAGKATGFEFNKTAGTLTTDKAHTYTDDCTIWVIDPAETDNTAKFVTKTVANAPLKDANDVVVWVENIKSGSISALYIIKVAD